MNEQIINFDTLVSQIEQTNEALQNNARLIINRHVTTKAWLTGYYIVEYEQNGSDRAKYGDRLLQNLAKSLGKKYALSTLKVYRQFYLVYPQLKSTIGHFLYKTFSTRQSDPAQLQLPITQLIEKSQTVSDQLLLPGSGELTIGQSVSAQLKMYLAYYRKNIMQPDDNPPVGILMCSEVGQEMAEYTLLDTDEDIFISKYELNIPSKERMAEFLRKENEGLNKEDKA